MHHARRFRGENVELNFIHSWCAQIQTDADHPNTSAIGRSSPLIWKREISPHLNFSDTSSESMLIDRKLRTFLNLAVHMRRAHCQPGN